MIRKLVAIALLALLLWGAYVTYAFLSSPPKFRAHWGNVTETTTELVIMGEWSKPVLLPVSVSGVTLRFMGIELGRTENVSISPRGSTVVLILDNENLVRAFFDYLDRGQNGTAEVSIRGRVLRFIPFKFTVKRRVTLNVLEKLNFTSRSRPILGGLVYTPALLGTKVSWGGERGNEGILIADMDFYNPNPFPIPVANLTFDLYADGIKVGEGYLPKASVIPASGYAAVRAVIELDEEVLPEVWAIHVRNGEESTVRVDVNLSVNVLGKTVQIPLQTEERVVKTDIIGEINEALSRLTRG